MKRKKNVLSLAALALSLMLFSCTNENDPTNEGGVDANGQTYATFNFRFAGASTRSITPETDNAVGTNDDTEKAIDNARLIIFNANSKALEYNEEVNLDNNKTTVLVTPGNKKIYVMLNVKDRFTIPSTMTLDEFLALKYDAGTPGTHGTPSASFTLLPLAAKSASVGFPMSSSNKITYNLAANVDEATAAAGTTSASGTSATNSFSIDVDYMLAKVGLTCADAVLNTDDAVMARPTYAIRNIAKETFLTQQFAGNNIASVYYYLFDAATTQANYDQYYDYSSQATIEVKPTTAGLNYVYAAENTNQSLRRGSATYAAIKLNYQPKKTFTTPIYNQLTGKVNLGTSSATAPNTTFVVSKVQGIAEIPVGTYFNSIETLSKAKFIATYKREPVAGTDDALLSTILDPTEYSEHVNGVSWYRLNIGKGTGINTIYGIERGNIYTADVTAITGPGVSTEDELITDPEEPLTEKTYISATITVKGWTSVSQSGTLQ